MTVTSNPFTFSDIEDVHIMIKAKGKLYPIVTNLEKVTPEDTKKVRLAMLEILLETHVVVDRSIDEL